MSVYTFKDLKKNILKSGLLFIISIFVPLSTVNAANLYGLVIGIDDYVGKANDLVGAVNDAKDISGALRSAGAKKVSVFLNKDATKAKIQRAWQDLVSKAKKGDTIVFTYSGHGSQEDEPQGRNGEKDGKNENFLLANFSPDGPGSAERIVDDELFAWLKMADDKEVNVVLVADSCHSGTMHRAIGKQKVRYRKGRFRDIQHDQLKYPAPEMANIGEDDLKHVTFVGATSDDRLTPEITINNAWRGALSWSFARALEGVADRDGDGYVSQLELLGYIIPAVKTHVENQQSPQIRPFRAEALKLFPVSRNNNRVSQFFSAGKFGFTRKGSFDTLRVFVNGASGTKLNNIKGVDVVSDKSSADVVWDNFSGTVSHTVGGLVAENVSKKSAKYVISKWSAIKFLKSKMLQSPVQSSLVRGDHRYKKGEIVEVEVSGIRYPYLTLFNLPPDGKVEFFLPAPNRPHEAGRDWRNQKYRQKFRVSNPPYGAEHLVSIYSNEVLSGLHAVLANMRKPQSAQGLREALQQSLKGRKYQVGIISLYTGK